MLNFSLSLSLPLYLPLHSSFEFGLVSQDMPSLFQVQSTFLDRPLSTTAEYFPHSVLQFRRANTLTSIAEYSRNFGSLPWPRPRIYSLSKCPVQTSKRPIQTLIVSRYWVYFLGEKRQGFEVTVNVQSKWILLIFLHFSLVVSTGKTLSNILAKDLNLLI
jgi:hypothetical protein